MISFLRFGTVGSSIISKHSSEDALSGSARSAFRTLVSSCLRKTLSIKLETMSANRFEATTSRVSFCDDDHKRRGHTLEISLNAWHYDEPIIAIAIYGLLLRVSVVLSRGHELLQQILPDCRGEYAASGYLGDNGIHVGRNHVLGCVNHEWPKRFLIRRIELGSVPLVQICLQRNILCLQQCGRNKLHCRKALDAGYRCSCAICDVFVHNISVFGLERRVNTDARILTWFWIRALLAHSQQSAPKPVHWNAE